MINQIYAQARLYDLAFSYRDYPAEAGTLYSWYQLLFDTTPTSVLELACGPGRHLHEFPEQMNTAGLDISKAMCDYAAEIAGKDDRDIRLYEQDMCQFKINQAFDLILLLINSVNHITSDSDLANHLNNVRHHLSPQGLYVIEAGLHEHFEAGGAAWSNDNGIDHVDIEWHWEDAFERAVIKGHVAGEPVADEQTFPMRHWTVSELCDAATRVDLKLVAYSGAYQAIHQPILIEARKMDNPTTMHNCLVFSRM